MSATESRRRYPWGATAATLAVLVAVSVTLWRYPSTELVVFHCVWIGLAMVALRAPSPRLQSWVLVGFVTGLATIIEVQDVRKGNEGLEGLVELPLDLVAFVGLVYLARRHRHALAAEHDAAVTEHRINENQRAFFANASHGLRTPITVARGHAQLVLQDATDPSTRADVAVILDELERLTKATDRILKLSVANQLNPQHQQQVEVDALIRSTVERWRPAAPRQWSGEPNCPGLTIRAERESLTEAIDALIDNAVAATAPGGAITVGSQIVDGMVVLSVTDDGPGVEAIDTERLFEPFARGPRRAAQAAGGTGLGLAIVRAVAASHGGEATMRTTPGRGTTVSITIPCPPSVSKDRSSLDRPGTVPCAASGPPLG